MEKLEQIKNEEMKLCYDIFTEKQSYNNYVNFIKYRIKEVEFDMLDCNFSEKGYEQFKRCVDERTVLNSLIDIIQYYAEEYNKKLKEQSDDRKTSETIA